MHFDNFRVTLSLVLTVTCISIFIVRRRNKNDQHSGLHAFGYQITCYILFNMIMFTLLFENDKFIFYSVRCYRQNRYF